jgi:hypothetical protein
VQALLAWQDLDRKQRSFAISSRPSGCQGVIQPHQTRLTATTQCAMVVGLPTQQQLSRSGAGTQHPLPGPEQQLHQDW